MFPGVDIDNERLKVLIETNGWRRQWAADRFGITSQYLSEILSGKKKPSRSLFKLMCLICKVEEDNLIKLKKKVS